MGTKPELSQPSGSDRSDPLAGELPLEGVEHIFKLLRHGVWLSTEACWVNQQAARALLQSLQSVRQTSLVGWWDESLRRDSGRMSRLTANLNDLAVLREDVLGYLSGASLQHPSPPANENLDHLDDEEGAWDTSTEWSSDAFQELSRQFDAAASRFAGDFESGRRRVAEGAKQVEHQLELWRVEQQNRVSAL